MKLLNSDFWVVTTATLLISALSIIFYFDYTSMVEVTGVEPIGTITFKNRIAQRKYQGQVIWEKVETKATVYNNDSIRTADLSDAVIHLNDGTEIDIDENSLILLSRTSNSININFEQGSISTKRKKVRSSKSSKVNIISKNTRVSIADSDISLKKNSGQRLTLAVSSGVAEVEVDGNSNIVKENEKALINSADDKEKVTIEKKPVILNSPEVNKIFITKQSNLDIDFSWSSDRNRNRAMTLEVSRNQNFKENFFTKETKGKSRTITLPAGNFYWRVKALNKKSEKISYSEIRKLKIIKDEPIKLVSPASGESLNYVSASPLVNFRWLSNKLASSYTLEVSKDKSFTDGKTKQTSLTTLGLDDLSPGDYFWRIKTRINAPGITYENKSKINSFSIIKKQRVKPPVIITPANKKISQISVEKNDLSLSWKINRQVKSYEVVVASDKNFRNEVFRKKVKTNYINISKKLPTGIYYWKVRHEVKSENFSDYSDRQRFTVVKSEKLTLLKPLKGFKLQLKKKEKSSTINFKWTESKAYKYYRFELSGDKNFLSHDQSRIISSSSLIIKNIRSGKYYWRVQLLDDKRNPILKSETFSLEISPHLEPIVTTKEKSLVVASKVVKPEVIDKPVDVVKPESKESEKKEKTKTKKPVRFSKRVIVKSPLRNSRIYVNKKFIGKRRGTYKSSKGNKFSIVVKARGYYDFKKVITLTRDEKSITINAQLIRRKKLSRIRWSKDLYSPVTVEPIIYNNSIITSTRSGIIYRMATNGKIIWKTSRTGRFSSTPSIYRGRLYLVTQEGYLIALNLKNGKVLWKREVDGPMVLGSEVKIKNDYIYFGTGYGMVYSFSIDGNRQWEKDLESGIFSSVACSKGFIFAGTEEGKLQALNSEDGDKEWHVKLDSRIVSASPVIKDGKIYLGTYKGTLYEIDMESKRVSWFYETKSNILDTPLIYKDSLLVISANGILNNINRSSGKKLWSFNLKDSDIHSPEISDNLIHITAGNRIITLDGDSGKKQWEFKLPGETNTATGSTGKSIFLGLKNGKIISLNLETEVIAK